MSEDVALPLVAKANEGVDPTRNNARRMADKIFFIEFSKDKQ
jgi:hypothetical protein